METHKRVDTGEKPFSQNGKQLPRKSKVPGQPTKSHVCGHCQKRFRSPGKLRAHAACHCSFCPQQFKSQIDATRHERTHTGEKPYACSMCPKRFSEKSSVPPHERTHTGEKPYACSICPKRFANRSHVVRHERTHAAH